MRTTQVSANLMQLTRYRMMNCFLVREDDGFTLVDTCMSGNEPDILAAAQAAGGAIRRIVLTHAHIDHVGGLDGLMPHLPEVEVMIGAREARFVRGDMSLDPDEPQSKLKGGFPSVETRPTRELQPGDRIGSLEVVAAPGHTPGQVAFLDTRDRTLIAGDAFSSIGGLTVSGLLNVRFPILVFATWDVPTAVKTAQNLRALEPARLVVGHGNPVENPAAAMDRAIARGLRKIGG